jgi:hypothetical protein
MSTAKHQLLSLSELLAAHEGVTHWAISMRFFRKGDFFARLRGPGDIRTATYEKALRKFSERWPADLEWPADIPRPDPDTPKQDVRSA